MVISPKMTRNKSKNNTNCQNTDVINSLTTTPVGFKKIKMTVKISQPLC